MKKKAVKWDGYFRLPNNGLKAYFGNVVKGRSQVIYTDFLPKTKRTEEGVKNVLDEWISHLSTLNDEWPTLYEFEMDLAAKVGPMSKMLPLRDRMEDIDHYYEDILRPADPLNPEAIQRTIKEFNKLRGLKVRSQKSTVEKMRKGTNSGSPYFTKRRNVVDKTLPIHHVTPDDYYLGNEYWRYCAILGWRGQEGGPSEQDIKQRVVWMFPFGINVRELQVYQPLIESAQRFGLVAPWISMEAVDDRITKLFDTKGSQDLVICTDFSKFDQHFNAVCQDTAKTILTAILSSSAAENDWLESIYPVKYSIPLAYDWGKIRFGLHGMGSGSGGTNADETLLHRALQHEAAYLSGAELNLNSMCLGDDGVLTYPGITVDDVLAAYTSHGLEMNASKQYASKDDCVFLRRWHHKNYRVNGRCAGVYSTCRALGRLIYRERFIDEWSDIDQALRELGILENCKYSPVADSFAHFVMERDPLHLGKDIPGFLDNIVSIAKERAETMNDTLSYTQTMRDGVSGIGDWWIVNYVKSH